jgi:hypothetical protein
MNNSQKYTRHLIECQCVLKIYENRTKPIFHKFPVFSLFDGEVIEEKFVECNNCSAIHKVTDLCQSEIMWGKDGIIGLVNKIDDIKFNLDNSGNEKLVELLVTNKIEDISIWEFVEYLADNEEEGQIVLDKNEIEDRIVSKILYINKKGFKIKNESFQRYV